MRLSLFVVALAALGCGHGETGGLQKPAPPPLDPLFARREEDAQAAYSLDAASASIADALAATKRLAPTAGGDAKEALLDVAEMLDSAGAALADFDDPPSPIAEYRKAEGERTGERQQALDATLDALKELEEAQGTLDDLAQNVPSEHRPALVEIGAGTDEAIDAVENAIVRFGGKVPKAEGE